MQEQNLERLIKKYIVDSVLWRPPVDRKSFIRLDLNEGNGFINRNILNQFKKIDPFVISSYPEYETLNHALAKYCAVEEKNICITSGSDHAIQMLVNLFFCEGDHVVIPSPTFFVYFSTLKLMGVTPQVILYKKNEKQFVFPFEETLRSITPKTKGLLLCNPSNPLGSSIPKDQLLKLVRKCNQYKIPIIIDEAYAEFCSSSAVNLISKYSNVIIIRTFSKAFGLAGLRLGYVVADSSVIKQLTKLRLPWAVNHFAIHVGNIVLNNLSYFNNEVTRAIKRKAELAKLITKKGLSCINTGTNFLVVEVDKHEEFVNHLRKNDILVNDVSHYPHSGDLLENCIRMCIPAKKDYNKVKRTIETFL